MRVRFVLSVAAVACLLGSVLPLGAASDTPNVVVLGIDGMDPQLLQAFVDKGRMPNFKRMMETGSFSPLQTSIPPQSPVAWSNFITGMDPGGHGIFDFIHLDRTSYLPEFSTALVQGARRTLKVGKWCLPLSEGKVELLRRGNAFWQLLDNDDVPYLMFRIPANFPPVESKGVSVSGMGTPDLPGSYGTFSFYTDDPTLMSLQVSGGVVYPVATVGDRIDAEFVGPNNPMICAEPAMTRPFVVHVDRDNRSARITTDDDVMILQEGEWSDWVRIRFDALGPLVRVSGITRLYLKSLTPHFQLYVTPINIDPADPVMPIASDGDYSKRMFDKIGYHYTQGMP